MFWKLLFLFNGNHITHIGEIWKWHLIALFFLQILEKTNVYTLKCHISPLNMKIEIYQNAKNDVNLRMSSCCADFWSEVYQVNNMKKETRVSVFCDWIRHYQQFPILDLPFACINNVVWKRFSLVPLLPVVSRT